MTDKATLVVGDRQYHLPVVEGSEGERGIDIRKLRDQSGLITLDPGYGRRVGHEWNHNRHAVDAPPRQATGCRAGSV